jgi:hypothetical protein
MKKSLVLIPFIFFVLLSSAQRGFGFDVAMSTSKAPMIAVKYYLDNDAASIGFSYQAFNDALGKEHDYKAGSTAIGDGDYFYSFDIGYTRVLSEKFSVAGEVSIGTKKHYQNLRDDNTSSGGYHRILKTESKIGGGGFVFYNINETFGLFAGYNSLREGTFGLEIRLFHEKQY